MTGVEQIETAVNLARAAADSSKCGHVENIKYYVPPAGDVNEKPSTNC